MANAEAESRHHHAPGHGCACRRRCGGRKRRLVEFLDDRYDPLDHEHAQPFGRAEVRFEAQLPEHGDWSERSEHKRAKHKQRTHLRASAPGG